MKTKIFDYKGVIGIDVTETSKFINDPEAPGQLGMVMDTKELLISKTAKEILSNPDNFTRAGGSFASVMYTRHHDGGSSVGILGYGKQVLAMPYQIGRDCEVEILDDIEIHEEEAPDDFKNFVDNNYDEDGGELTSDEEE